MDDFDKLLEKNLKNKEFKKTWIDSELEYQNLKAKLLEKEYTYPVFLARENDGDDYTACIPDLGITTQGCYNDYIVQKSAPLQSMKTEGWTMSEYRILDMYLSKINSNNPDDRTVVFEKGEFEKLLGVTKINKADLEKQLDKLKKGVEINGNKISLFLKAEHSKDFNEDCCKIELKCSDKAIEYIFNTKNFESIVYDLKSIVKIKSCYTYKMFLLFMNIIAKSKTGNVIFEITFNQIFGK